MGDHVCPWWLAYTFDNPLRPLFHRPEKLFAAAVKQGMTVADLGCGLGYFSLGLAKLTGPNGRVFAVDLQPKMLDKAKKRAIKAGVAPRVHFIQCQPDSIELHEPLDFCLAFWMAHETPDLRHFLQQIHGLLKPGGLLFLAEPFFHVSRSRFEDELHVAEELGFQVRERPAVAYSRAALLGKIQKNDHGGSP